MHQLAKRLSIANPSTWKAIVLSHPKRIQVVQVERRRRKGIPRNLAHVTLYRCDLGTSWGSSRRRSYQTIEALLLLPPKNEWKLPPRPSLCEYRKIEESASFETDRRLVLRVYQLVALNWLMRNWYNGRPSILADEMGLWKTIQTLDRLHLDPQIKFRGPFLIVTQLSSSFNAKINAKRV